MANNSSIFTCPTGGQWYACGAGTSKFVGCCASDPCSKGCVQGDIRSGGYNATEHGTFPDAECGYSGRFYTCSSAETFWGCCKTNPCTATPTCPASDLVGAFLDRPEQFNFYAPSASPSPASNSKSSNGAVIGGAIGGGLGAAIIIGVLIFFYCRRKKRNQQAVHPEVGATASTPMMKQGFEDRHSAQYGGQSPPPMYSSPNPNIYHSMSPNKDHHYRHSYTDYSHGANGPQELPAETTSPTEQRYSELPAEASSSNAHRMSELPAGATQVTAELESPQTSPRPLQGEFSSDLAKHANQTTGAAPAAGPR